MNRTGESQEEEMAVVTVDGVRTVIHSFLERITAEEWALLQAGTPDDATIFLVAEMIMEFIISTTNLILARMRSTGAGVCKERALNSLSNTLHQSFIQALEFPEEARSVSSESLTRLIAKEVTENVNSALSASTDPEEIVPPIIIGRPRIIPSRRLNTMVGHASAMLSDFMTKVKSLTHTLCTLRPRRSSSSHAERIGAEDLERSDAEMEEDDVERPSTGDSRKSSVKSGRQDTPKNTGSQDSFLAQTSKAVQEIIRQELYELTEPLLYSVEDSEYEDLQSYSPLEFEVIGDDISRSLMEEVMSLEHRETESKDKLCENDLKSKINSLFVKLFAKSLIHRMVAQLKSKYQKLFKGRSRRSAQSFVASVESLLLKEYDITEDGSAGSAFERLEKVSSGKHQVLTNELDNLIHSHSRDGMVMTDSDPESERKKSIRETIKQHNAAMYNDVSNRVKCFLSLMNWWLKTRVSSHSSRVVLALMNTKLCSRKQQPGVMTVEDARRSEEGHADSEEDATSSRSLKLHSGVRSQKDATRSKSLKQLSGGTAQNDATSCKSLKQLSGGTAQNDATRSEERHAELEEDAALKKRKYQIAVSVLVEKLICRLLTKTKTTIRNAEALTDRIFAKTWAEVETLDFNVTAKSMKKIDKAIFKDLCKVWKSADMAVISLKSEDPLIEKYIATSFVYHLTPKKRSAINKFFCGVGKVLSGPFRRIS